MDNARHRGKTAGKQEQYIRLLEEELAIYKEKDRTQEELIGKLQQALGLFAEEVTRLKEGKGENTQEGG